MSRPHSRSVQAPLVYNHLIFFVISEQQLAAICISDDGLTRTPIIGASLIFCYISFLLGRKR